MPRLGERLARLEAAAAGSVRPPCAAAARPSIAERLEAGLLKLGSQRLENESRAGWFARTFDIPMTDLKTQVAGDWRKDLTPGSVGYYIGSLLVIATEDFSTHAHTSFQP